MTGQVIMDKTILNEVPTANVIPTEEVECDKSIYADVATIDVTTEEINCNQRIWTRENSVNSDGITNSDSDRRKRSETWSSGFSDGMAPKKNSAASNNLRLSLTLDTAVFPAERRSSNSSQHDITNNFSFILNNKTKDSQFNNPLFLQKNLNSPKSVSLDGNLNINSPDTFVNGSVHVESIADNEDLSGFTDVNLARSNCSLNKINSTENFGGIAFPQKVTTKTAAGSWFDWVPNRTERSTASTSEYNFSLSRTPPSSNTALSGFKVIQQALKSTLSSKNSALRNNVIQPMSTTALILENRPSNLPQKSVEEIQKHQAEYAKMIENAKKLEIQDLKKRKKYMRKQQEYEESVAKSSETWLNEILPHWSTMRQTSRTRQLWWLGLPPNVRGKVWRLAIGNELNITKELYSIMVIRSHDKLRVMNETPSTEGDSESIEADRENTVELIRLDISRTFPHLCIFQKGGPYHQLLHDVLGAYACYRPDVGYVQGMSFMAAMLLLNMEPAQAFVTFANLLNKPCQVAFFRLNEEMMKTYFATFEVFFEENLPRVFAHFKQNNLTPDMYLIDWIFTIFSKALDLDTASRVWDVFCRDGEDFLFCTAIAILKLNSELLLSMEFIQAAQYLSRLPSTFTHQELFNVISDVTMTSRGNRRWKDVLSLMKDGT